MTQTTSRAKPLHEYPPLVAGGEVLSHYGIDSSQYNALTWISENTVLMPAGKFLLFVDAKTGRVESQEGPIAGGIGTVAVHPSRKHFVVGERSPQRPRLLVYEWPSRKQIGEFDGNGCSVGYAASCFDRDGTRVATVAAAPDYTLAVWDWESRTMALRSKCFSTDVYTVCFSAFNNSLLVTGGSGHVKFWSMADTFTGLKLQGTLGKFGRLEISNISGFVVLPDAKVLSGSENGSLLLWEGDLVKCSFVRSIGEHDGDASGHSTIPCHNGAINAVALIHDAKVVVTFGDDGWIRYWSREELELAEGEGVPAMFAPQCLAEVCVGPESQIRSVTLKGDPTGASSSPSSPEWVLLDSRGTLCTSPLPSLQQCMDGSFPGESAMNGASATSPAQRFNGGGISCCAASPIAHVAVTGGDDGVIRLIDYLTGAELAYINWSLAPNALETNPGDNAVRTDFPSVAPPTPVTTVNFFANDTTYTHVVVGFGDGSVRLLALSYSPVPNFTLLGQWKPHTSGLFATVLDCNEARLCTVARDGTAFFFAVSPTFDSLEPIGFCRLPLPEPTCADWDEAGDGCLIGFEGGQILSIRAPQQSEVNRELSFEFPCEFALIGIRQRRLPPPVPDDEQNLEEDEVDLLEAKDNGPWAISLLRRLPGSGGAIAIGMQKEELLYTYKTTVRYANALELPPLPPTGVEPPNYVEDPEENICYRDLVPQRAFLGVSGKHLLVVCNGARVIVREARSLAEIGTPSAVVSLMSPAHDGTRGTITSAQISFDGAVVITTGTDGLMVAQVRVGREKPKASPSAVATVHALSERSVREEHPGVSEGTPAGSPTVVMPLSIQEQKEADDAAHAREAEEKRRNEFLGKVLAIQERHAALLETNAALPQEARLSDEEMRLDHTLQAKLDAEKHRQVEEARKQYVVESAREQLRTAKLRNRFVDNFLYDRFLVHAFQTGFSVASFRTADPSTAIARLQREIAVLEESDDDSERDETSGKGGSVTSTISGHSIPAAMCGSTSVDARQPTCMADNEGYQDETVRSNQQPADITAAAAAEAGAPSAAAASVGGLHNSTDDQSFKSGKSKTNASVKQQLQKADERREERQTRRDGYAALLAAAPNPEEDAALLAEMERRDLEERGECVLRTDPTYKCHSEFRPTASAKLHRMIALEKLLVAKRSEFNERLLAARERKRTTLEQLNKIRSRICEVNEELGDYSADGELISLQPDEEPEKVLVIDRAGLDAFAKRKAMEKLKEEEAKKAQRGFGADLAEAPQQQRNQSMMSKSLSDHDAESSSRRDTFGTRGNSRSKGSRNSSRLNHGSRQSTLFLSAANRDRMEAEMKAKLGTIKLSEMEEEERAMRRELLTSERQRLVNQAEAIMKDFDNSLYTLFRLHADVDADLCLGDVHLLLLFREYQMLLVFRNQDRELRRQLRSTKSSREATQKSIQALQGNLRDFDAHLTSLQDRLKLHKRDAEAYIHEACPAEHVSYLLKIFNRHIKRRKNTDEEEDNDDITSDDEDEDLDDGDSEIGEELCPPNCDLEVWTRTLALREERLDISDEMTEKRRKREESNKQLEKDKASLESIVAGVKECLHRIEELDHEKRRQLNLLSIVAPLRSTQVKCLDRTNGTLPDALWNESVVVLQEEELRRLAGRIEELAVQKVQRREEIASMAAELQRLREEKARVQKVHAHWEDQVHEVMLLKFGQHVDLEMLESCGTSHRIEAKKEELRQTELRWDREVRKRENHIAALRDELQRSLLHNTHLLQDLGDYEGERQQAERTLAKVSAGTVQKFRGTQVATKADRTNLKDLIAAQQEEMDALNAEIFMLRRKGGHAYSPATASY